MRTDSTTSPSTTPTWTAAPPVLDGRIAGAPISWGVCEVPGWGHVLPVDLVLGEMAALGLRSTELGPPGFLPDDPAQLRALLDRHGLGLVGGFVALVLHDEARVGATLAQARRASRQLAAGGAQLLVLAAATGVDGYDERPRLDDAQWDTLVATAAAVRDVAAACGLRTVLHPHVGTLVEEGAQIERFLADSDLSLCLDTGHLLIGGADPLDVARRHAARIGHVHLKDVNAEVADRVRRGAISYLDGVRAGLYVPLGRGDVPVPAVVNALEDAGYHGWYVLEQDAALPLPGTGSPPTGAASPEAVGLEAVGPEAVGLEAVGLEAGRPDVGFDRPRRDTAESLAHLARVAEAARAVRAAPAAAALPPLLEMTRTTPTCLWNDSADPQELARSLEFGAVGATCNPVIALAVIRSDLPRWRARIAELAAQRPTAREDEIGWLVVEELSRAAATLLEPVFERDGGRNGRLSVQTDPRHHRNAAALVDQALHFDRLAPNIVVKIPATAAGIEAIEEVTWRGVSVNATVSFTVSQALAVGEAVERALRRREAEGLPTASMGPVCTIMVGRLDDWLKVCAESAQVVLDPGWYEWAGVAAFKRAYGFYRERGYRTRLLSAAFRNHMHWSEFVGGDVVISPPFDWQVRLNGSGIRPARRIDVPVAPQVVRGLYDALPDFRRAWDPDGLDVADFDSFGATRRTLRQFLAANSALEELVRDVLVPDPAR